MALNFVGYHLAPNVFVGKLPATRGVWLIIGMLYTLVYFQDPDLINIKTISSWNT